MTAYYNEIDPYAAEWIRELISAGEIAPGVVDERSIEDVTAKDVMGFTQCHFFAGVAGWGLALRQAGWPDGREVWTGSCPCQPFSSAGKGGGFDDERHLWPAWFWLISQCRPDVVYGEQVASKDARTWFDLVSADLEGKGYAIGAVSTVACGFGASTKRQRLYFVADTESERSDKGHPNLGGRPKRSDAREGAECISGGDTSDVADNEQRGHEGRELRQAESRTEQSAEDCEQSDPGPTNGFWRDADWLFCCDKKWRAVEPGTFPLAPRVSAGVVSSGDPSPSDVASTQEARTMRLKGYGNSIVVPQAMEFIRAAMQDTMSDAVQHIIRDVEARLRKVAKENTA